MNNYTLSEVLTRLHAGQTLFILSHLKSYKVDKKVLDRFKSKGYDLFKQDGSHLMMMTGKKYLSIQLCKLIFR